MNEQEVAAFWRYTLQVHKRIDRLQLVYADGIYNYDLTEHEDLLAIAKKVFEKCEAAEVRVSTQRMVTFIMTVDNRIFDL